MFTDFENGLRCPLYTKNVWQILAYCFIGDKGLSSFFSYTLRMHESKFVNYQNRNNVRYRYARRVEKPTPAVSKKETEMCVYENLVCEVKTAVYIK